MKNRCIIVGAGHCGGIAAAELRAGGYEGEIMLLGEEASPPYQRPPLSKDFLAGRTPMERLLLKPAAFYAEKGITLRLGTTVASIDRGGSAVVLADGERLTYERLLLATGGRVRKLSMPGAELDGICYLRTLADAQALRERMAGTSRVVIVGGGYIGLEAASVAVEAGKAVTVLEMGPRLLGRVASPPFAQFVQSEHEKRGVRVVCGASVSGFEGTGKVSAVVCGDTRIEADLVIVGVGILPNVELAAQAGLACDNGIVVDERCRTADPAIFAAGDCTNHPNALLGRRLRLESVPNAMEQGKTAASNICGKDRVYSESPWFWSNQFDLRLQMAGLVEGSDETIARGKVEERAFALFHLREGAVIAVEAVNFAREFMACRKLAAQQARVPAASLADPAVALQTLG
jgi:3-phenylpropionate/trans-cinnamate dioxygenase ferredoxin reductase subunit